MDYLFNNETAPEAGVEVQEPEGNEQSVNELRNMTEGKKTNIDLGNLTRSKGEN